MGNVDDSATIGRVFEALGADPALTRRAAIIAIAGEGSLRRIERKMAAIEGRDPHALDTARRATVHARHAAAFPVAGIDRDGIVGFCARFLDGDRKERTAFLAVDGSRVIASFKKAVLVAPEGAVPSVDLDLAQESFSPTSMRVINALSWYGLVHKEGWERRHNPGGTVCWNLAAMLCESWRDAGLGGHLATDDLFEAALAAEEARLEDAGLGRLLDRFPDSFLEAVSGCARHVVAREGSAVLFGALADWVLSEPTRAGYLRQFGPLAMVAFSELCERKGPVSLPPPEVMFRIVRDAMVPDERGTVTPADASWLVSTCLSGIGLPAVTKQEARAITAQRPTLEPVLFRSSEREALGRLLRIGHEETYVLPKLELWLHLSQSLGDRRVSLVSILEGIDACAGRHGVPPGDVAQAILAEAEVYVATAWAMLAWEIPMDRSGDDRETSSWWHDNVEGIARETERAAFALLCGGKGWTGLADGIMAWVAAGRPGFALAAKVRTDHVGRVSACAVYDLLERRRPGYEQRRAIGEFTAFLAALHGRDAYEASRSAAAAALPLPPAPAPRRDEFQALMDAMSHTCEAPQEAEDDGESVERLPRPWWRRSLDVVRVLNRRRAA